MLVVYFLTTAINHAKNASICGAIKLISGTAKQAYEREKDASSF